MKITITTPIKAYLNGSLEEIEKVRTQLAYTNTAKSLELKRHLEARWFRDKNPKGWEARKIELQGEVKASLLFLDGEGYWIRVGSIAYLKKIDIEIDNQITYPIIRPMDWKNSPIFEPYFYQDQSANELLARKHACVSLATGLGKSFLIELLIQRSGFTTIIVAPGESVFNELLKNLIERFGSDQVGGYGDGKKDIKKRVTVSIAKSLTNLKEGSEAYDFFKDKQMMIVDESHTFAANTLDNVCHGVLSDIPYRFFLSATQSRGDGTEKVLQSIIGPCVFDMPIGEGISQGFLCPLNFVIIDTYSSSKKFCGDPIVNKREHFLYNKHVAENIANIAIAKWSARQESSLILVEELVQIQSLVKLIQSKSNVSVGYAHAASKKDSALLGLESVNTGEQVDKFNNGEYKILIGTRCISTGTNMYPTHNTFNWVGGASEIITKQGPMGRSTRKLENSKFKGIHKPKPSTTIFDFNITNNKKLTSQLEKRIAWYKEANENILYLKETMK